MLLYVKTSSHSSFDIFYWGIFPLVIFLLNEFCLQTPSITTISLTPFNIINIIAIIAKKSIFLYLYVSKAKQITDNNPLRNIYKVIYIESFFFSFELIFFIQVKIYGKWKKHVELSNCPNK